MFARAFNNPEENPNILNATSSSINEFQYQKDKEIFKSIRATEYAIVSFDISTDDLGTYDFEKKQFHILFDQYRIMGPEEMTIYRGARPPVIKLKVKNNLPIIINVDPELGEKLKSENSDGVLYVVLKIKGKDLDNKFQHISVDISDYICLWEIKTCGDTTGVTTMKDFAANYGCTSDFKIFRK